MNEIKLSLEALLLIYIRLSDAAIVDEAGEMRLAILGEELLNRISCSDVQTIQKIAISFLVSIVAQIQGLESLEQKAARQISLYDSPYAEDFFNVNFSVLNKLPFGEYSEIFTMYIQAVGIKDIHNIRNEIIEEYGMEKL
jgi:hypothetical protein